MQWVFREELMRAARLGLREYTAVWCSVLRDTSLEAGPTAILRLGIASTAVVGTLAIMLPVLLAIPTHFPKPDAPCLPRVYAPSRMEPTRRSEVSEGVDDDPGNQAEMQAVLPLYARNPLYKQPSRSRHDWRLARKARGSAGQPAPHRS